MTPRKPSTPRGPRPRTKSGFDILTSVCRRQSLEDIRDHIRDHIRSASAVPNLQLGVSSST
ncbi:unnamed protein product, partial [Amoebophrya sp. A25]|eukprot:GSA25T00017838001.1